MTDIRASPVIVQYALARAARGRPGDSVPRARGWYRRDPQAAAIARVLSGRRRKRTSAGADGQDSPSPPG